MTAERAIEKLKEMKIAASNLIPACGERAYVVTEALILAIKALEDVPDVNVGNKWIPVSERLPENEQEVEISCKRTYISSGDEEKTAYFTARAFYIDGKMNTEDSRFSWWDSCYNWEYDAEKDAFIIPEGWWEYVTFSEEFGAVDAEVLAWKPLTDPFKGE